MSRKLKWKLVCVYQGALRQEKETYFYATRKQAEADRLAAEPCENLISARVVRVRKAKP